MAGIVVSSALIFLSHQLHLNLAATGFSQLLVIVVVAVKVGFWEATAVSLFANLCLWYIVIPPAFSFAVQDPQNWVALVISEIVALIVSQLSSQAKLESSRAIKRQEDIERLYDVSRQLLSLERGESVGTQIARLIARVFPADSVVFYDASTGLSYSAGKVENKLEQMVKDAFASTNNAESLQEQIWIRVLHLANKSAAVLALKGSAFSELTSNALASLSEVALERARTLEKESRVEAERRTQELRTALLDSLAHEFKTPLTAIRTASTGLLAMNELTGVHHDLVSLVDGEAERLSELTNRLIETSRIDSAEIRLRIEATSVCDITTTVLRNLRHRLVGHEVELIGFDANIQLRCDRELVTSALSQLVDNAAKYSTVNSPISIRVSQTAKDITIAVHNWGTGVRPEHRQRIFERFFRAPGFEPRVVGTGLGLSVAKRIMEAHHGTIFLESEPGAGALFTLCWPNLEARAPSLTASYVPQIKIP